MLNVNPLAGMFQPTPDREVSGMLLEKHLPLCIRAHNGTSHSPEKRGRSYVHDYSLELASDLEIVKKFGGDEERYREKYERLFVAWMSAKSNCLSSMITGPSGFPTRRAEKANNSERNRSNEFTEWREKALAAIEKAHRRATTVQLTPIEEIRAKVEQERTNLEAMKSANKIIRVKKLTDDEKLAELMKLGWSESKSKSILSGDAWYGAGFPTFSLTNCRNRLKASEARLLELERRATTEAKEVERPDGIKIVLNAEANRLQVFFPDKPDADIRAKLKGSGFRWAPSVGESGAWQSYLNSNAVAKLKAILPE